MKDREIYVPPEGPGQTPPLSPEIYEAMGEENIFSMLSDFYQELGKSAISQMFDSDLEAASKRSAAFYVQLLGGPPLYNQQFGNPMMRRRHFPFVIAEQGRQVWESCFFKVLEKAEEKYNFPAKHLEDFKKFLHGFSKWMVNTKVPDSD